MVALRRMAGAGHESGTVATVSSMDHGNPLRSRATCRCLSLALRSPALFNSSTACIVHVSYVVHIYCVSVPGWKMDDSRGLNMGWSEDKSVQTLEDSCSLHAAVAGWPEDSPINFFRSDDHFIHQVATTIVHEVAVGYLPSSYVLEQSPEQSDLCDVMTEADTNLVS
ncbi:hypothetical protein GW17_00029118 [Ensete ventricosum]|nr:hypothetical protein GW17_00029118 [Ensete ventricosum]